MKQSTKADLFTADKKTTTQSFVVVVVVVVVGNQESPVRVSKQRPVLPI